MNHQTNRFSYAVTLLTVAVTLGLSLSIYRWTHMVAHPLFYAAVAICAWFGGLKHGVMATIVSCLILEYFFAPPMYSFAMGLLDVIRILAFLLVAFLISFLHEQTIQAKKASEFAASSSKALSRSIDLNSTLQTIVRLPIPILAERCELTIKPDILKTTVVYEFSDRSSLNAAACTTHPLLAGGMNLGTISFWRRKKAKRRGNELANRVIQDFVARAAMAISNAHLYHKAQESRDYIELLLRETHHRTKNNLQLVCSLLSMQRRESVPEARQYLQESENLVHAVARIHESLFSSDELERVDLKLYLSDIAKVACSTFVERRSVQLQIDIPHCEVDITSALLCGVIVNEVVTNSVKHAFGSTHTQDCLEVRVDIWCHEGSVTLNVSDNGVGIPDEMNHHTSQSFGLKLIHLVSKQLGGTLNIFNHPGVRYQIKFQPKYIKSHQLIHVS